MSTIQGFLNQLRQSNIRIHKQGDKLQIKAPPKALTAEIRQQIGERKAEILVFLANFEAPVEGVPAIQPVSRRDSIPLSFPQERLWFLNQFEGNNSATYNIPQALRLSGAINLDALQRSMHWVIERHESLRSCFTLKNDQAQVQILSEIKALTIQDLQDLDGEAQSAELQKRANAHAITVFDLTSGPLFKADLLLLNSQQSVLLVNMHHIISDGWSIGVFMRDWQHAYTAFYRGQAPSLAKLDIQYYDYANWQRTWLQGDVLQRQLDYWQQQLTGATELLELPTDQPRQAQQGYKGAHYGHCLPATLSDKINSLSREHSVSLFMTMLSAFYIFLSRYSRQDDISVGSPIANRTQNQTEDIIGLFVNTLVFRGKLQAQQDFTDLLRATRKTCLGAYAHQDVPLELLVEKLQPARNLSYSPLFQVMLSIQNNELSEPELPGLEVSRLSADYPVAKFDLTLFVEEREGQLHCLWEYATDLFDASTIERMSRHFEVLLTGIVENPEQDINQLPMLTNIEAEQLKSWSQSAVEYPTKTIVDVFEQQVGKTPDKIALVYQDQQLSYQQVNEEANQLAHYLLMRFNQVGITEHNPLIAIATERSADMVVAVLAILKAGGAYVPIDPSYPAERFNYLLNDCNAPMLLVQAETQVGKVSQNCMVLRLDQTDLTDQPRVNPNIKTHTDDLAYINYTSGSTGQPKGVCIPHQAVVRLVNNASNTSYAQLDSEQIFLHYAAVSFDAATFEIWGALLNGAKVVVMPAGQTDLKALAEILQKQDISILWMTNSLFNIMLEEQPEALRGLKQLLTGGEALSVTHINKAINCLSDTQLINGYGPTENTTFTCCYPITEPSYQHSIPIGKAIANTTVAVVDNMHQPVAVGLVGELVTGGAGLARGYLNRPELSAEKFVELNLFGKADRFYKTGDLVRWRPDGNLEYIGRIDHQVKLRGFRIELGEIEAIISQHSAVNEAVVVLYEADNNKRLVAYITLGVGSDSSSDSNSDLSASETMVKTLTEQLKQQLPEYMQPSHFTVLDLLPLTANGKVDRKALPVPEIKAESGVKPITPTELILANLWSLILKVEVVHRDDNFFKLGGHSLLATQLIARIRDTFQVELPVRSVFEFSQLNALATAIELANGVISLPKVQRQAEGETKVLSFAQQRLWFLDQLEENSSASYNIPMAIQLTGRLNVEALRCSLNWLIERHESLRALFPTEDGLAGVKILDSFDVLSIHKLTGTDLTSSELPGVVVPELQDKINRHAVEPFNLTSGPLFKADLLVLKSNGLADDQQFVLLMSMHHIISDGWSIGVFMRDWQHAYTAFSQNQQPSLEPLDIQYSDYAAWQRQWLQGEVLQKQLDYWQQHLAGIPNLLELPTNKPRPAEQSYKGARYACSLPLELSQGLNHLSREHGVSLFMTVLSAYYILLARYSRQDDICVGTPIANRTHSQAEDLIGFFVNTLVLRGQLQAEKSFTDLLRETRKTCLSAYAHQDIPFEMLVEQVQPTRSLSHSPLFQAMLVLQNNAPIELELPDINIEVLSADYPIAKFDLTLNIEEREGQLFCVWEYATDLFNAVAIKRMAGHFETLLAAITDKPEQAVCDLPMLTARELENLKHCYDVVEDNAGVVNTTEDSAIASHDKSIVTLFETQAENTPDNIALVFEKEQLSYRQLNEQANQLAHQLLGALDRPAKPNTDKPLIAIAVERSMDMVVGILAILKAGCAYVPIDPNYPKTRIAYLLKDSAAPILLTQNHLKSQLPLEDTQSLVLC
ncbi:MAG: hypothetical protein COA42_21985 [Alteromonadaceae bacterium]|nr:MAG: hypothetical protein COA42_21985 [Alteromonadaceae bacterium]